MGITERHWFEDEEPELTDRQLQDIAYENKKAYDNGYVKGYHDALIKENHPSVRSFTIFYKAYDKRGHVYNEETNLDILDSEIGKMMTDVLTAFDTYVLEMGYFNAKITDVREVIKGD